MISRNNILPTLLLVIAAVTLVNCAPAVPCNVVGSGSGSGASRLHRSSSTDICGNGGGGGTPTCSSTLKPVQVLLSVDSKGAIQEYGIDSKTGALTLMCNTATAALGAIAVANNTFVYVLDQTKSPAQIFGFLIAHGNSGALAPITGSPFALSEALAGNSALVADPLGRFMFVTNSSTTASDVHVLTIGQSGALTEATNSPFVVSNPDFIAINPAGNIAFVPDSTDGDIFIFSLDANGQVTNDPNSQSPFITGTGNNAPHFALVHPNGNFLLTANQVTLSSFSIDSTHAGALTQIGGSPFSPGGAGDSQVAPLTFALDESGKFLYVTPEGTAGNIPGFTSENIVAFAFDTTAGGMTPVPMSPFISTSTLDIVANPLLEQMFIVSSNASSILFGVAPIDASGNLTLPTTSLAVTAEIHPVVVNIN
jgi:6-phosphogluconolactonase (cycloisomerase 2 family)